ncbi:MAG TPA: hypothetical protein VE967_10300, partial [Gemmatimonadaceae bacterium]|nr:hypothetical protein [Gemmatimonadaceae bacterium]
QQLERPVVRVEQKSGTTENLIAVSAVNGNIAWVGGLHGTYGHTTDGGATWKFSKLGVPDADKLEFRDVYAVNAKTAYLLSVGPGHQGRIYKTDDAGEHWLPKYTNIDTAIVWRAIGFWTPDRGVAISDAISGEFLTMLTEDGGWHWRRIPPLTLPGAMADERSPSSSGTILMAGRSGRAWFGTTKGRVLRSTNYGASWKLSWVPVTRTDTSGVVSLSFRDKVHGMAFAGIATKTTDTLVAVTGDGGETWEARAVAPPLNTIFAGSYVRDAGPSTVVIVGPQGASYSRNNGFKWERLDNDAYNSVAFATSAGWLVGPNGRITRLSF